MTSSWRTVLVVGGGISLTALVVYLVQAPNYRRAQQELREYRHPLHHEASSPPEAIEHAVIVHLGRADREGGKANERSAEIDRLAKSLSAAISTAGTGGLDGKECSKDKCLILMYGSDADRLFNSVEPLVRRHVN
jgi:hypothetical protein